MLMKPDIDNSEGTSTLALLTVSYEWSSPLEGSCQDLPRLNVHFSVGLVSHSWKS